MTPDVAQPLQLLTGIISNLRVLGDQCGELGEMKDELLRVRAELGLEKRNLATMKGEVAEAQAQYNKLAGKCQDDYTRMMTANTEKQKELNRTNAELDRVKAGLAVANAEFEKLRKKFGG
jgi:hypothetical protein